MALRLASLALRSFKGEIGWKKVKLTAVNMGGSDEVQRVGTCGLFDGCWNDVIWQRELRIVSEDSHEMKPKEDRNNEQKLPALG